MEDLTRAFLHDAMSLDEFEEWSAHYSWNIHKDDGKDTLAYKIRAILNATCDDNEYEANVRRDLERLCPSLCPSRGKTDPLLSRT